MDSIKPTDVLQAWVKAAEDGINNEMETRSACSEAEMTIKEIAIAAVLAVAPLIAADALKHAASKAPKL
jgi:hypothetical protein